MDGYNKNNEISSKDFENEKTIYMNKLGLASSIYYNYN